MTRISGDTETYVQKKVFPAFVILTLLAAGFFVMRSGGGAAITIAILTFVLVLVVYLVIYFVVIRPLADSVTITRDAFDVRIGKSHRSIPFEDVKDVTHTPVMTPERICLHLSEGFISFIPPYRVTGFTEHPLMAEIRSRLQLHKEANKTD